MRAPKPLPSDKVWAQLTHFSRKCSISHNPHHGSGDFVPELMKLFEPRLYLVHQNCNNTFSLHLVRGTTGKFCLVLINFDFVLWNRQLQLQDGRPFGAEQELDEKFQKRNQAKVIEMMTTKMTMMLIMMMMVTMQSSCRDNRVTAEL